MSPLALMIRPRGSSPHHSLALVLALAAIRASKPFPLVHITSSAPSMLIASAAKTPLSNSSFVQAATGRPSYWPPLVISTKTMRATLLASATAVRLNLYLTVLRSSIPLAHRRKASLWPRRWRSVAQAHHQKLAQVAVAHLCDAPEPRFAAGRVLARCQAEEGSELTPAREGAGVLDGGHDRRGGDRADARNGHQPLGRLVRFDRRRKLPVDRSDGLIERVNLADKRTKCAAHAIGDHDLAILVETVGHHALQAIGMVRALRRDEADLGQMAAQSIERRRALAGEQLARPMAHQLGLVVDRTHRHEPLARPTHRLVDRRCVNLVVFVAAHVGLHMSRRNEPHFMSKFDQRPSPMMRRRARLHRHHARRQLGEERDQLAARELAA